MIKKVKGLEVNKYNNNNNMRGNEHGHNHLGSRKMKG